MENWMLTNEALLAGHTGEVALIAEAAAAGDGGERIFRMQQHFTARSTRHLWQNVVGALDHSFRD